MKQLKMMLLFLFLGFQSYAQIRVTGKVSDTEGVTLPGVNVLIKGTTKSTITDINGNYSIQVPNEETVLRFSFVGFKNQFRKVGTKKVMDIILKTSTEALDEIVVVGYGEVRKRDVTGSISKVKESDNVARQYSSVDALLQGRSSGV